MVCSPCLLAAIVEAREHFWEKSFHSVGLFPSPSLPKNNSNHLIINGLAMRPSGRSVAHCLLACYLCLGVRLRVRGSEIEYEERQLLPKAKCDGGAPRRRMVRLGA